MTDDLKSKTVEELREYMGWDTPHERGLAFNELARRLEEAQQRGKAYDAEVAAKALEEFGKHLREEGIYVGRIVEEKVAEYRAKAGRKA